MQMSRQEWLKYKNTMASISQKASNLMQEWVDANGLGNRQKLLEVAYALVEKYGNTAGAYACQLYDEIAIAQKANVKRAEIAKLPEFGEVAKAVNGAWKQSSNLIPSAVGRLTKQVGADTTLQNAQRDRAQFAWIPSGDTCAFCITLASRGWQYMSKNALKNGHAEHIHANCDCQYAIRFDNYSTVDGYDPEEYLKQYRDAGGDVNAMRRMNYLNNKDTINAQKRVIYNQPKPLKIKGNIGILDVEIDEFVPCLRDNKTGELVETQVYQIKRKSSLRGYNKANGWNVDWQEVYKNNDVYALTIKGEAEIQGLIGMSYNRDAGGMYLAWASAAPWNTKQHSKTKRYNGVGGHLFAIAAEKTLKHDKNGFMYGFAKNKTVLLHYINKLHADYVGALHQYHIVIETPNLHKLLEEYNYEWRE